MLVLRAADRAGGAGAGKFDWSDTYPHISCLGIFVLSLFAQSAVQLLARHFTPCRIPRTPFFYVAIVTEASQYFGRNFVNGRVQVLGLAIAFSLASFVADGFCCYSSSARVLRI